MTPIIRKYEWSELPIVIPVDGILLTMERVRTTGDLDGIPRQIEELRGENHD